MSSMMKCLLSFLNIFKLSYFPAVVLKLSYRVSSIFWTLASYSDTKFANKSSHSTDCLFILLVVKETILFSLGNFRTLAKVIWPHMCEFV